MMYQVTDIEFDFTDDIGDGDTMDDFLTDTYKQEVVDEVLGIVWEADDDEDLVEEVTAATGFCVKSIDSVTSLNNTNWSAAPTSWQGVTLEVAIRQTSCL